MEQMCATVSWSQYGMQGVIGLIMMFVMTQKERAYWCKRKSRKIRVRDVFCHLAKAERASGDYYWAVSICSSFGNKASTEEGNANRWGMLGDFFFCCMNDESVQWLAVSNTVQIVLYKSWVRWVIYHWRNWKPWKKKIFSEWLLKFQSSFISELLGPLLVSVNIQTRN